MLQLERWSRPEPFKRGMARTSTQEPRFAQGFLISPPTVYSKFVRPHTLLMSSPQQILAQARKDQIKLAGCGLFAQVFWVVDTEIALKKYDEPGEASAIEKQIYERLGIHPFILQCYGEGESIVGKGLVLQYLHAGTLADNLELDKFPIERKQ